MGLMCSQDDSAGLSATEAAGDELSQMDSSLIAAEDEVNLDDDAGKEIVQEVLAREAARIKEIQEKTAALADNSGDEGDDIDKFFGLMPDASPVDERNAASDRVEGTSTVEEMGAVPQTSMIKNQVDGASMKQERSAPDVQQMNVINETLKAAEDIESVPIELNKNTVEQRPPASASGDPDSSGKPEGKSKSRVQAAQSAEKTRKGQAHPKSRAAAGPEQNAAQTHALQDTMKRLTEMRQQLSGFSRAVSELQSNVKASSISVGKARTELAQLEAELNKLQCKGIDAVNVATINDPKGQEKARSARRELVKLAEMLYDRIDVFFGELRSDNVAKNSAVEPGDAGDAGSVSYSMGIILECAGKMSEFAGTYEVDVQNELNDRQTWRKQNGTETIFFTKTLHMLVASAPEAAAKGKGSIRTVLPVRDTASLDSARWSTYSSKDKKWCHDADIIARLVPKGSIATSAVEVNKEEESRIAAATPEESKQLSEDPYNLRRFCTACRDEFDAAVAEIKNGKKVGCWSWYFFPVAPFMKDGVECGSEQNRLWCLRDKPPFQHRGDDAAKAFLKYAADGVNLREMYLAMMTAVAEQLEKKTPPLELVGPLDDPKLRSSLRLFERVSRGGVDEDVNAVCQRALSELREPLDSV